MAPGPPPSRRAPESFRAGRLARESPELARSGWTFVLSRECYFLLLFFTHADRACLALKRCVEASSLERWRRRDTDTRIEGAT